ncbi:MAG: UDP-N-acetylmuramate--L-alanine ligase [Clostridia bacterium]|nr:UDP-N-acetylmuramate--L-alanine ligase [Clostridia bacterium]
MDEINLENIKNIHFIGIGGISMSGIAIIMKKFGYNVTGSDISENDMVKIVKSESIPVTIGQNTEVVLKADLVVYTAAIPDTDLELVTAINAKIPTFERAVFLGKLLTKYEKPICIAGMHGKTTTTSMVANALKFANTNPTVLVGSKLRELNNLNYEIGGYEYFVLESCEYVDSFLNFPGNTAVILNIEEEHLDYFKNLENIKKSFSKFMNLVHNNGNLIVNTDDAVITEVLENTKESLKEKNINIVTYSITDKNANLFADNINLMNNGCYEFDVIYNNKFLCHVNLSAPGKHNVLNGLATLGVALVNNIDINKAKEGLEEFTGASRRFEFKKFMNDTVEVYDDYAHHPTEIKATLQTAKEKHKNKVYAVFQPHTYSRLKTLLPEFATSFFNADMVIVTEIYAAREISDGTITSEMLVEELKKNNVNAIYIKEFEEIAKYLKQNAQDNDIVLTIGAGTITKLSDLL